MLINFKYLYITHENLRFSFGFAALILFISFLITSELWVLDLNSASSLFLLSITPVVTYSNADEMKESIIKENKDKSGVYRWVNLINGRTYVGSSVNLSKRFTSYYSYKYLVDPKRNMLIDKALIKYGYSNFKLDIMEYCDRAEVRNRENYFKK